VAVQIGAQVALRLLRRRAASTAGRIAVRSSGNRRPWWLVLPLLATPGAGGILLITLLVAALTAVSATEAFMQAGESAATTPDPGAVTGIPKVVLDAYTQAALHTSQYAPGCTGMRWSILAAVGQIESQQGAGHRIAANGDITPPILGPRLDGTGGTARILDTDRGRLDGDTIYDRAVGPMQFIPSSWVSMGRDGNGDGIADPNNIFDAAAGTVVHLCGRGAVNLADRTQLSRAIFGYNSSDAYVADVLSWITTFDRLGSTDAGTSTQVPGSVPAPDGTSTIATLIAIMQKSGLPYVVTSTYRPGDTSSYHGHYQAVDFAMPGSDTPQLLALDQYWARYAAGLSELIYTGPGGTCVKNGVVASCAAVYGAVVAEHHNHVHVAATPDQLRHIGVP